MAEYINRDEAIRKALEVCVKVVGHGLSQVTAVDIVEEMEIIPTEDVVPVVRCKDCKHYKDSTQVKGFKKCAYSSTTETDFFVMPDDFCNYGERKDDNGR